MKFKYAFPLILIISVFSMCLVFANVGYDFFPPVEARPGYISEIEEDETVRKEVLVLPEQPEEDRNHKYDTDFYSRFREDIMEQYKREFGYAGIQQSAGIITLFEKFEAFEYIGGLSVGIQKEIEAKRNFGNYMMKRFAEYHMDDYLRSRREFRKIYETKETLSNIGFKKDGYKFKVQYSLSGNELKLRLISPRKIQNEIVLDFESKRILKGRLKEVIFHLFVPLGSRLETDFYYAAKMKKFNFVLRKQFLNQRYFYINAQETFEGKKDRQLSIGLSIQN